MRKLIVVAALIKMDEKILICQRGEDDAYGLLWEFPGGVVEDGETLEEALVREIKEELGVNIRPFRLINNFYDTEGDLTINVHLFECLKESGDFLAIDCRDFAVVDIENISKFNLAPVDKKILTYLKIANASNKR